MTRLLRFETPPGKPVLRGHDHFWRVIRELDQDGGWSVPAIRKLCDGTVETSTVRDFVKRLVAGGIAFVVEDAGRAETVYRLARSPTATPRLRRDGTPGLQGRGQIQMWNMIRGPLGRDGFTARDLSLYASTETVEVKPATAVSYVRHLAEAGYLVCLRKGKPGQPASYRLKPAMNTGPLPPLILSTRIVFDQNRAEAVGPIEASEVEP